MADYLIGALTGGGLVLIGVIFGYGVGAVQSDRSSKAE